MKMNWLTKQLNETISDMILNFTDFFKQGVIDLFNVGTSFADLKEIKGAVDALTLVGCTLVVVLVLKEILGTYVLETDGDPDGDPFQYLIKAAKALCLICCNDFIFNFMAELSTKLANDMKVAVTPETIFVKTSGLFLQAVGGPPTQIINTLFIFIFLVFVVILSLKAGLRGVELALMKILWPIFSLDNITVSGERWNAFFSSYLVTFLGYILQLLTFTLCIDCYSKAMAGNIKQYLFAAAWMYFSLNTPKWLEKFAYSSGLSKVARGGSMGLMQIGMMARFVR